MELQSRGRGRARGGVSMEKFYFICFCVIAFILGACFGSFSGVLICRLPAGANIATKPSHCDSCGKQIKFYDNIPIISYIVLGGKCRYCKAHIPATTFVLEIVNAVLWALFAYLSKYFGYVYSVAGMLVSTALLVAALIDAKHGYIPDSMSVFIAVIGAIACFFDKTYVDWKSRLIALAFSVVFFGGFYLIARLILKKEAMGFGDVKLMAACGLALGIKSIFFATLVASVVASVVLGITAARKKEKGVEYPFAPYLALGCILALFIGEWVISSYLSLLGI